MRSRRVIIVVLVIVLFATVWMPAVASAAPSEAGGRVHVVRRGQTLSSIAARYGVSLNAIAKANNLRDWNVIYVGQRLRIPKKGSGASAENVQTNNTRSASVHTVRRGENLSSIAVKYGVTTATLKNANGIRNANRIYVGQRLNIPGRKGNTGSSGAAPKVATGSKWVEVDLSRQRLIAHQGNTVVLNTAVSTGLRRTPTPIGTYRVRNHIRRQTMSGPGYRLPNVQFVMYFVGAYALHGTYWHNNFGRPMSHGCINLRNGDARFLYKWAGNGTKVVIHR